MKRLYVPEDLRAQVADFLRNSTLPVEIVTAEPFDLQIVPAAVEREPSDTDTLRAAGSINCATAWTLGQKHNLDLVQLGALFNLLQIRVCNCSLGCFK